MPERSDDWRRQAEHDLQVAARLCQSGDYDWSCFAAQQAAEKAIKSVFHRHHQEAWGHSVAALLRALAAEHHMSIDPERLEDATLLDRFYIPARYPNAHPQGAPFQQFTRRDAETAIAAAEEILRLCDRI